MNRLKLRMTMKPPLHKTLVSDMMCRRMEVNDEQILNRPRENYGEVPKSNEFRNR